MKVVEPKSLAAGGGMRAFLRFPLNDVDGGGGTGGSGAGGLVTAETIASAAVDDSAAAASADPAAHSDSFGDLSTFKDPDNGLFMGKYKTVKDVMDGYKAQSGKLREKFPEPPASAADYKFTFDKESGLDGFTLTTEDPVWGALAPIFHKGNVTQETAQEIVQAYLKHKQASAPNMAAEKAKLGAQADTIIGDVSTYARKQNNPALNQLVIKASESAETLKELHTLMKGLGERKIPNSIGEIEGAKTASQWNEEAAAYKLKYKDTISTSKEQQKTYYTLMENAQKAKKAQS